MLLKKSSPDEEESETQSDNDDTQTLHENVTDEHVSRHGRRI